MATYLPFFKLRSGRYLIGTQEKHLILKGTGCMVRTGGGFMYLDEYLRHYSKAECIKLNGLIRKGDCTVKNTVISMLKKHKADEKSIARYEKACKAEIDQQF